MYTTQACELNVSVYDILDPMQQYIIHVYVTNAAVYYVCIIIMLFSDVLTLPPSTSVVMSSTESLTMNDHK